MTKTTAARIIRVIACAILIAPLTMAGCQSSPPLPTVLGDKPTASDIQQAVNRNSQKIKTLVAPNATLGAANVPGWARCQLAFERPSRVRVIGTANMMGRVFDTGTNDDILWYWDKFREPQELAWCKKSEFANPAIARDSIPIDPTWLPEALGLTEFNSQDPVEGPIPQFDKTLLLISKRNYMGQTFSKYTYVEPKSAAVKRQDIQDARGNVLFTVTVNEFQLDAVNNIVLPKRLTITSPPTKDSINLDLGSVQINGDAIPRETFQMPRSEDIGNVPVVNVASRGLPLTQNPTATPISRTSPSLGAPAAAPVTPVAPATPPQMTTSQSPLSKTATPVTSPAPSISAPANTGVSNAFQIRAVAN
ncbi:MAG: hypothetical protein Q4G59_10350 [Planctomycetia bacterium]|nr:hypothetical protein [Planctomycetia bacterium]